MVFGFWFFFLSVVRVLLCALEVRWLDDKNRLWVDDLRVWEAKKKKNETS